MLMLLQVGSVSVSVYVCVCTLLDKLNVANREDNMKHLITVHRHRGYGVICKSYFTCIGYFRRKL